MKNAFLCLFLTPWLLVPPRKAISQELYYQVKGHYDRPVTLQKLRSAKTMEDFCAGFPTQWITHYLSSEVSVTSGLTTKQIISRNDTLSQDQMQLLQTAKINEEINVTIQYLAQNPVLYSFSKQTMKIKLTVVPEQEAKFKDGLKTLSAYLYNNAIQKITPVETNAFKPVRVLFTIEPDGAVSNVHVHTTSCLSETDKLLIHVLQSMPGWEPARDENNKTVKQEFELFVGNQGC